MRQTRTAALREEFDKLIQNFERVVDCKDNFIKLLVSDLSEAEQQSALAHGAHLQSLDHLLELQKSRLAALESHWNTSVKELSTEYNTEREQLFKLQQQEIEYLKAETQALMQRYEEKYFEAIQDYEYTLDRNKIKYAGMKHAVKTRMTEQKQWYLEEQQKYINTTDDKTNNTFDLQEAIKQMNLNKKHMQKLQGTINALRSHLSSSHRNTKEALDVLYDCEPINEEIRELKANLSAWPLKSRLANYCQHTYDTINKLQNIIQEGEALLRVVDVCHKLETVQEKVLPFYTSSSNAKKKEKAHALEVMSEELAQTMVDQTDLEKFWQRYNKVVLERMCLEQEKKVLRSEKQQLKSLLKQYMDGISGRDEILEQPNSLLMVSRPPLLDAPAPETKRKTHKH
ncbi:dynein regulatory complex subunit 2-like [Hemibagrus wyckioides]|uniref:dynein regulatory complex subunit 2-like n=1 Tax=Hemibagrus wyckioides TaxID=337641 RepID=UPI00266D64F4|nr:dynein regulatory complex subunit 2-like [Hemibagrus wyckioides]